MTEKLDGENTTIYADATRMRAACRPATTRRARECGRSPAALPLAACGWRLRGKQYGRHSIAYDALPSYFQLFAVYDSGNISLSGMRRRGGRSGWKSISCRCCTGASSTRLRVLSLLAAAFGPEREGVVVRWASAFAREEHVGADGKLVRKDHVKTDQHWMSAAVVPNRLAS